MQKKNILWSLGAAALVLASGALINSAAQADGVFNLVGTVPQVNQLDVMWANEDIAMMPTAGGGGNIQGVIAALKVYSNDANGFTIKASGLRAGGTLLGGTTAVAIAYKVALFSTYANAMGGTVFLAAPGTAGVDSAYATPNIAGNLILTSGTLTTPVDTGTTPYYLGYQILGAATTNLMADSYTDTLTVFITGL